MWISPPAATVSDSNDSSCSDRSHTWVAQGPYSLDVRRPMWVSLG